VKQDAAAREGAWRIWAVAAGWAAFAAIVCVVNLGLAAEFDRTLLLAMRAPGAPDDPLGPLWLEDALRDLTTLGGSAVLFVATAAIAAYLWANHHGQLAAFAIISVLGAQAASEALKAVFDRPRPDLAPHEVAVYSASLPSGHAMMAAACYFTLAYALAREQGRRRNQIFPYALATLLVLTIGLSRVYLGVHWPTDVLAGWCAGGAWAVGASWIYRRLAPRPA